MVPSHGFREQPRNQEKWVATRERTGQGRNRMRFWTREFLVRVAHPNVVSFSERGIAAVVPPVVPRP